MFPIPVPPGFRIIAHRGASGYAPENTAAAFDLARQLRITEIETDTQLTTDGAVVLCHDRDLARYGYPGQAVEALTLSEVRGLDMGSWFSPGLYGGARMMTLEELFYRYGDSFVYHLELKGEADHLADAVGQVIRRMQMEPHCIITSFDYAKLARMRRLQADIPLGWLVSGVDAEVMQQATEIGLLQLCPRATSATAALVAQCREAAAEVRAWGLSGSGQQVADLSRMIVQAGCDGATINWPDWLTQR